MKNIRGDYISMNSIEYGSSLGFSSEGNIIAIGHERASTQLTPMIQLQGNHGSVRVYEYRTVSSTEWNLSNTSNTNSSDKPIIVNYDKPYSSSTKYWVQLGNDIGGNNDWNAGDGFGKSLSINNDGDFLVVGVPLILEIETRKELVVLIHIV